MIFNAHNENVFGVKKLTDADLGRGTSHQTHIGLYEGVLSYLRNTDETKEAYLVYKDSCERLDCYFDRIENPDGTFRSPKIRYGHSDSIVKRVREYAANGNVFYLLWFGLDNNELFFLLFEKDSEDYDFFCFHNTLRGTFGLSGEILRYIFSRFARTNENILADLELKCQGFPTRRRYRSIDVERANALLKDTGRTGEVMVCRYLERLKQNSVIKDYSWMNEIKESGLPYDFTITNNNDAIRFIDVKTTRYGFDTPMVFSSQEVSFIVNDATLYSIFRVYGIVDSPMLRICDNSIDRMKTILNDLDTYAATCREHGYMAQTAFFVAPTDSSFSFTDDIVL